MESIVRSGRKRGRHLLMRAAVGRDGSKAPTACTEGSVCVGGGVGQMARSPMLGQELE